MCKSHYFANAAINSPTMLLAPYKTPCCNRPAEVIGRTNRIGPLLGQLNLTCTLSFCLVVFISVALNTWPNINSQL